MSNNSRKKKLKRKSGTDSFNGSEGPKRGKRRQKQQPISGIGGTFDNSADEHKGIKKSKKKAQQQRDVDGDSSWDEGNGKTEEMKEGGRQINSLNSLTQSSNGFIGGQ